jgi:hypothetical protein
MSKKVILIFSFAFTCLLFAPKADALNLSVGLKITSIRIPARAQIIEYDTQNHLFLSGNTEFKLFTSGTYGLIVKDKNGIAKSGSASDIGGDNSSLIVGQASTDGSIYIGSHQYNIQGYNITFDYNPNNAPYRIYARLAIYCANNSNYYLCNAAGDYFAWGTTSQYECGTPVYYLKPGIDPNGAGPQNSSNWAPADPGKCGNYGYYIFLGPSDTSFKNFYLYLGNVSAQ